VRRLHVLQATIGERENGRRRGSALLACPRCTPVARRTRPVIEVTCLASVQAN